MKLKTSKEHCNYEDCKKEIVQGVDVKTTFGDGTIYLCDEHKHAFFSESQSNFSIGGLKRDFEGKKVGEVKELTEQFKKQNPDVKTAEELLEDLK